MLFTVRPIQLPEDYGPVAELLSAIQGAPVTADSLQAEDSQIPTKANLSCNEEGKLTGFARSRWLAVSETGAPLGYAVSWRAPWTKPGAVCSLFGVHPDARLQGIGRLLAQTIEEWARSIGAELLMGELPDQPSGTDRFIERTGLFSPVHIQKYRLDLTTWSPSANLPSIEGLRFFTLADAPGLETELYELYARTLQDNPGHVGGMAPYQMWLKEALPEDRCSPELVFLAAVHDRLVGVSTIFRTDEPDLFYTDYTGVDRSVRGKGLARALKEQTLEVARQLGARRMLTETEASNSPMRQLNLRMGYQVQEGTYVIMKRLD